MRVEDPVDERFARELFAKLTVDERHGFRDELRSKLLIQVAPAATARRPASPWWALRIPRTALAAVAVVFMLLGGSGLAAAGSLPGEPLFGLKRTAEELVLALAPDAETRLERLADQASARLAELARAAGPAERAVAAAEAARAAERLSRAAAGSDAVRGASSERATTTVENALEVLRGLEGSLPAEAQHGIRRAIEAVETGGRGGGNDPASPSARPGRAPGVAPEASASPSHLAPGPRATPPGRAAPTRGQPAVTPPGRDASRSGGP